MMWFDFSVMLLFACFAIVSGFVWPKMLNDRITTEAEALKQAFPAITGADYGKVMEKHEQTQGVHGYVIPTLMFTVIVIVGSSLLVLDTSDEVSFQKYEILYGTLVGKDAQQQAATSFLMMQAAFLGAFLWSLQHLLRRAQARDIGPTTIYRICLYMLFGMVLSIFVNHAMHSGMDSLGQLGLDQSLPVIGFFTGYFSIEMFETVTEWALRKKKSIANNTQPPSLTVIEGISYDTAVRLRELWVDDAYALAHVNPIEIYLKTPFGLEQCIDWVGQAQLLLVAKGDAFLFLRSHGVRTILQLETLLRASKSDQAEFHAFVENYGFGDDEAAVRKTLQALGSHAASALDRDLSFRRLRQLCDLICPATEAATGAATEERAEPADPAAPRRILELEPA